MAGRKRSRPVSRRPPPRRRGLNVALFLTLGLVGAFLVSLVARLVDRGEAGGMGAAAVAVAEPSEVRVEVLNGAGRSGIARDATDRLRSGGFDVVYFGNAPTFDRGRSVVLDRLGDVARARGVAAALGIDSVAVAVDSTLLLDVTVVLGEDWPPVPVERSGILERLRGGGRD